MSLYVKYLVCYDISNTRTRSKFFDFLKDLGLTPIQKSVFFGDLKTPEVRSLKAAAEKWLDASCDSCLYFPCHLKVEDIRKCFGLKGSVRISVSGEVIPGAAQRGCPLYLRCSMPDLMR